jgi:hypothetical protein
LQKGSSMGVYAFLEVDNGELLSIAEKEGPNERED